MAYKRPDRAHRHDSLTVGAGSQAVAFKAPQNCCELRATGGTLRRMSAGLSATSRLVTGHALLYNDPEVDQFERALGPRAQVPFGEPAEVQGNMTQVPRALNLLGSVLHEEEFE